MNNISLNQVDMYARIINSLLTPTQKFDLVNKILATLRPNSKADEVQKEDIDLNEVFAKFSSDFGGDASAQEIANEIRYNHPKSSREIEPW
ncbi:hypothetical protein HPS57_07380 [Prevotella sp. PINT]|jgi:hypothetical protein|uniref:hypothetical protein n=1 Tax=Palleniella intestinalis TaxID=2736291 RepID=UPI0015578A67|nr:hypothetical protein [Palleniella intestinalis]NPD81794.1 hypothetical protein [Palleniella intestinalis]